MPNMTPAYVRLFNLLKAIRELPPFNSLTADEELLLEDLIVQWHDHDVIKMSDVIRSPLYPSRSTVHRRLIALRDKGLVIFELDPDDKRERFIRPSGAAQSYINRVKSGVDSLVR